MKNQVFELINSGKWGNIPELPKQGFIVPLPGQYTRNETKEINLLIKDVKDNIHLSIRNKVGLVVYFEHYGKAAAYAHKLNLKPYKL